MGYPSVAGQPNYSSSANANGQPVGSKLIPQIWSNKWLSKFYANTMHEEISNTDYEGEIKNKGDEVIIRTVPTITINDHEDNQDLTYETPESDAVSLKIDQGHYAAFQMPDVAKYQSDMSCMDKWAEDAAQQMKIKVDKNILGSIYASAAAVNAGLNAGNDTGGINLGTSASPLLITSSNIVDILVERFGVCLDETDTPDTERWVVLPPAMCARIKTSELKDASLTGDGQSTLRTGKIGMIDRLNIYSSRHLNVATGQYDVLFGHKSALSFAAQITKMEELRSEKRFADLMRSLFVYGFDVLKSEQLGHSVMKLG
jgi:hypothetical protein